MLDFDQDLDQLEEFDVNFDGCRHDDNKLKHKYHSEIQKLLESH